jgi:NADH:ubiquinone oxidoreductase subunit F (NADH-binding)
MHIRRWAERRSHGDGESSAVEALRAGRDEAGAAAATGLSLAAVHGVRSFYQLLDDGGARVCTGTACSYARGWKAADGPEVHCLGRCYQAPCVMEDAEFPIPARSLVAEPVVLRRVLAPGDRVPAEEYGLPPREQILSIIEASGLRGRGGAAFPTAAKWRAAARTPADLRYVVANGDEGDPGSYVDRLLLERDPHSILAGMNACAAAIGARRGIVYIRGEYPRAVTVMRRAIDEAGPFLDPGFEVTVHVGAGSYVCGEESALLRGIEGMRAEPSPRPPYPAQAGLDGKPTVVQNVETLAAVPWVLRTGRRPDTKAFSLSGAVATPCAVEASFGTPLRSLLEQAGGGPAPGRRWKMALVGGPMGSVLPESRFDTPLTFSVLPGMGHGGIVVMDDAVSARDLAEHLFRFAASESCGNCTPCRAGTAQLARQRNASALERLMETMERGSLCGFGQGAPRPIRDLLRHFPGEMFRLERP